MNVTVLLFDACRCGGSGIRGMVVNVPLEYYEASM